MKKFVVTHSGNPENLQRGRWFNTIEAAEKYIKEDVDQTVVEYLSEKYIHVIDIFPALVYTPDVVINVTTPEEGRDSTD